MDVSPPPLVDSEAGVGESLRETLRVTRSYLSELLELVAVEARLNLVTLLLAWILAVAIALLAVTAWLALVAAMVVMTVRAGADWPAALLGAAAFNGLLCMALVIYVRRLMRAVGFDATRESLAPASQNLPT